LNQEVIITAHAETLESTGDKSNVIAGRVHAASPQGKQASR
jgi:hypothetical protein